MAAHLMAECLTDAARLVRQAAGDRASPEVVIEGACVLAQALFLARWQAGAAAILREVSKS
jgi:hypothetical protein